MPAPHIVYDGGAGQWAPAMTRQYRIISNAASKAMNAATTIIRRDGRAAIAAAGFGKKQQNGLRVRLIHGSKNEVDAVALVNHSISYFAIFQSGGTIKGNPYLWIPLPTVPKRAGGKRITAGNYAQIVGAPLHSIRRPGKPPLLAAYVFGAPRPGRAATLASLRRGAARHRRGQANTAFGGKAGRFATISLPLFVGVKRIHIRRRFDLRVIYRRAQQTLLSTYLKELSVNG